MTLVVGVALGSIGVAMPDLAGFVVRGLFLGFAGQAVKVCSDTIVQEDVDDTHRGRVFSWYDVAVNVGIVTGVVLATVALATDTSTDGDGARHDRRGGARRRMGRAARAP